jgi:hypothetical protein
MGISLVKNHRRSDYLREKPAASRMGGFKLFEVISYIGL